MAWKCTHHGHLWPNGKEVPAAKKFYRLAGRLYARCDEHPMQGRMDVIDELTEEEYELEIVRGVQES